MEPTVSLLTPWAQFGLAGLVIGALWLQVLWLQLKLLDIVKNNTSAMTELKGVIDKCQIIHRKA